MTPIEQLKSIANRIRTEIIQKKADQSWEGCDGCTKEDEVIYKKGFVRGYNLAEADSYTEEQAREIWKAGQEYWKTSGASITFEELTEKLKQPKQ